MAQQAEWPQPVFIASLRPCRRRANGHCGWERLTFSHRHLCERGLDLPPRSSSVQQKAQQLELSVKPEDYLDSAPAVLAIALVEPSLEGVAPLTVLSSEQQWFHDYFMRIDAISSLKIVKVAALSSPRKVSIVVPAGPDRPVEHLL